VRFNLPGSMERTSSDGSKLPGIRRIRDAILWEVGSGMVMLRERHLVCVVRRRFMNLLDRLLGMATPEFAFTMRVMSRGRVSPDRRIHVLRASILRCLAASTSSAEELADQSPTSKMTRRVHR